MSFQLFYSPAADLVVPASTLQNNLGGINPNEANVEFLNVNGWYPVNQTAPQADPELYTSTASYVVSGQYADQVWTATPVSLLTAKENGTQEEKQQTNQATIQFYQNLGYSPEVLVGVAAQPAASRAPRYQAVLDVIEQYATTLNEKLNLIDAATTVDEINDVVNPPTGTINIGRGPGAEDLLVATFTSFNSVSMTESGTELYIPGTTTTIAYSGSDFPATAACFGVGDYVIQLRQVANGLVIKEFEVPVGLTDIDF